MGLGQKSDESMPELQLIKGPNSLQLVASLPYCGTTLRRQWAKTLAFAAHPTVLLLLQPF